MQRNWFIPDGSNLLQEPLNIRPERFKSKPSVSFHGSVTHQQQRTVVRYKGNGSLQQTIGEHLFPVACAKSHINSGVSVIVGPSVFPSLQMYFFEL
jgi:hypothetical protein